MDIDLLRYFLSVAQTQSIRESSALVGISPAGLSKGIKGLEQKLGYPVIESRGRGIRLTAAGAKLARDLKPTLTQLETILRSDAGVATEGPLRIATFEIFSTHLIAQVLGSDLHPTAVDVIESVPGDIEDDVLTGRADLGITINPAPREGLTFLKAAQFYSKVFVLARSPMLKLGLAELPFVVPFAPERAPASRAIGLDGWPAERPRRVAYRVSMMETALSLCRLGKAAGWFPEAVVSVHNEALRTEHRLTPHPGKVPNEASCLDVFLVVRDGDDHRRAVKVIAKELRRFAKLRVT